MWTPTVVVVVATSLGSTAGGYGGHGGGATTMTRADDGIGGSTRSLWVDLDVHDATPTC